MTTVMFARSTLALRGASQTLTESVGDMVSVAKAVINTTQAPSEMSDAGKIFIGAVVCMLFVASAIALYQCCKKPQKVEFATTGLSSTVVISQ